MADSFIQLPPDGPNTGKKWQTETATVGGNTVHKQVVKVANDEGSPLNVAGTITVEQTGLSAGEQEIINRLARLEHFAERICGALEEWLGSHSTL